eukprot:12366948-Alexandrium_andersonii.AAC.1
MGPSHPNRSTKRQCSSPPSLCFFEVVDGVANFCPRCPRAHMAFAGRSWGRLGRQNAGTAP